MTPTIRYTIVAALEEADEDTLSVLGGSDAEGSETESDVEESDAGGSETESGSDESETVKGESLLLVGAGWVLSFLGNAKFQGVEDFTIIDSLPTISHYIPGQPGYWLSQPGTFEEIVIASARVNGYECVSRLPGVLLFYGPRGQTLCYYYGISIADALSDPEIAVRIKQADILYEEGFCARNVGLRPEHLREGVHIIDNSFGNKKGYEQMVPTALERTHAYALARETGEVEPELLADIALMFMVMAKRGESEGSMLTWAAERYGKI